MRISGMNQTVSLQTGQTVSIPGGALEGMRPDETVVAEVVSSDQNGMVLRMADGKTFTAVRDAQLDALPGDILRLTITGRSGGQVTAELAGASSSISAEDATQLLRSMNLRPTADNVRLLQELVRSGVTPTRELMTTLSSLSSSVHGLGPDVAAFMVANNMVLTEDSIAQMQSFFDGSNQLGQKLGQLVDLLGSIENFLPDDAPGVQQNQAPQGQPASLAPVVPEGAAQQAQPLPLADAAILPQEGQQSASPVPPQPAEVPQQQAQSQPAVLPENATVQPQTPSTGTPAPSAAPFPEGMQPPAPEPSAAQQSAVTPSLNTPEAVAQQPGVPNNTPQPSSPLQTPQNAQTIPADPTVQTPQNAQTASPTTEPAANAAAMQQAPQAADAARPDAPQQAVQNTVTVSQEIPASPSLRAVVESLFRHIDPARAEGLPREISAPQLMRDIADALSTISQRAAALPEAQREAVTSLVRDVAQNLNNTTQVNQFAAFVQIPITLGDKQTTADLYVWGDKNKKNKKIDPENATIFLSLSTSNIGQVESYVRVLGKNVECNFNLEDENALKLIRNHVRELDDLLAAHGYRLGRISFAEGRTRPDPLSVRSEADAFGRRYIFDRRV